MKRREYDQRGVYKEIKSTFRRQPHHSSDYDIYEFTNGFEGKLVFFFILYSNMYLTFISQA